MIEVRLMLHDTAELDIVKLAVATLESRRRGWVERQRTKQLELGVLREQHEMQEAVDEDARVNAEAAVVAGHQMGKQAATMAAIVEAVTPEQMETAVKAFAASKGMAAARALLDEFKVQRVGEVTGEQRAALYARLTA